MGSIPDSPLGRAARYPEAYDAELLYPVERAPQREALGLSGALPFAGVDRWTAWEVAWLDEAGRPRVAIATFDVPCTSPRVTESKSVKLWLASLNHARIATVDELRETLRRDLSAATGADVDVAVHLPSLWAQPFARREPSGVVIDDETPSSFPQSPDAHVLDCADDIVEETLITQSFRSVCPVTGQPDYADVAIGYRGARLSRPALRAYLIGFRRHAGFHEHCVERIFVDIASSSTPQWLHVEARFTRRGGVDINPVRARGVPARSSQPALRQ